jgi:hypothetical protein
MSHNLHLTVPHPFHLTVANNNTGAIDVQSGAFTDEEWHRLSSYLASAHRLAACRLAETQSQLNWRITGERGEPTRIEATLPPEDDIAAFLHYLRPFILVRSPISFARTRNTVAGHITLPSIQRYLKRLKAIYLGEEIPFQIEVGSRAGELRLDSAEAIDKWLNGLEYHPDVEKRAFIEAVFEVFTEPATRAMFLYCMLERASAIGKLGAMIDAFAKRDGRQIRTQ